MARALPGEESQYAESLSFLPQRQTDKAKGLGHRYYFSEDKRNYNAHIIPSRITGNLTL